MKSVKKALQDAGKSEEEVKEFETGAAAFAKKIVANFKDWEFLTGESMNPDGMSVLAYLFSLLSVNQPRTATNPIPIGSSSSTTARMGRLLTLLRGSTVSRRRRCKVVVEVVFVYTTPKKERFPTLPTCSPPLGTSAIRAYPERPTTKCAYPSAEGCQTVTPSIPEPPPNLQYLKTAVS